jgi:peptidoglycan/LPS O-acetylase OafA/YrhL
MLGLMAAMLVAMLGPTGWLVAGVAVATGLLIAFVNFQNRALDRVGDVSYSLYLLHLPVGVTVIGCLSLWLPYSGSYLLVLDVVGLAASGVAAWTMYQLIEKPSQEMSSAIRFVRRAPEARARQAVVAAEVD